MRACKEHATGASGSGIPLSYGSPGQVVAETVQVEICSLLTQFGSLGKAQNLERCTGELLLMCCCGVQKVLCNDCGATGDAQFHFVYHKCLRCTSYNTRVLS